MNHKKSIPDIFTKQTMDFVFKHIEPKGLRILEVGCGTGAFGAELMKTGATVTALDSDQKAIDSAISKGLNAKHVDFLSYQDDPFDVIIFTRSLHHIHRLKDALQHSASLLKREGKLMLEEFDLEHIDYGTVRWYYDIISVISEAGLVEGGNSGYVEEPLEQWEHDHEHEHSLNTGKEMINGVHEYFKIMNMERGAYLYRSICGPIVDRENGYDFTRKILEIENRLIHNKLILPVGLRIVAEKQQD
ncbi:class I SAM-dependent methyltransferase [Fulvivirgaceae bacterium BMA10]|uniref:Class I SAM-dependent methyltransferase n=1 Tax=Splendidivirga corallicola TaxID=3051826 RepID=A0ABT8KHT2_9BACT|nr:class I SAM-dependent methyltransferase [Fulvivirgaceae bacterium BMA10]